MSTATLHTEKKKTLVPQLRFQEFEGEWIVTKLGEAFSIFNGYAFSSNSSVEEGVLWVKIADVGIQEMKNNNLSYLPTSLKEKHKKFILKKGDFVVALTRPILNGKLKIAQINSFFDGALLNQRVGKIISINSHYFIFSLLQKADLIKSIENNIAGSDPPNLSPNEINSINISIPTLPEQQKIASFLSTVDEKTQQLSRKKELLEQYKKGVMQQLFSGKLRFKDEDGKDYADWEEKNLGELCKIKSGLSKVQNDNNTGHKVTRIETISNGIINLEKVGNIEMCDNIEDYKINKGDILFSNINSVAHIGKTAIAEKDLDLYHGMNLLCLRTIERVNSVFLYYFLNTQKLRNYFRTICNQAVNQASINQTQLTKTVMNFPCFEEQHKIANFLSSIDNKIESVNWQLNQTQSFKKGLLQQMFV